MGSPSKVGWTTVSSPPSPDALPLFMQSRWAAGRSSRTYRCVPQSGSAIRWVNETGGGAGLR
ncbi:Uncharacterised protein [Mycobacteroides abscessus subsp. abscessus]|nr:Uncharacterised protein [Mycobacteroides abscessus subsp. abscessus]